jgi:hypothetical protein
MMKVGITAIGEKGAWFFLWWFCRLKLWCANFFPKKDYKTRFLRCFQWCYSPFMYGCGLLTSVVTQCGENGSQTRQDCSAVPFWFMFRVIFSAAHKCCTFFRLQKTLNQISEIWK